MSEIFTTPSMESAAEQRVVDTQVLEARRVIFESDSTVPAVITRMAGANGASLIGFHFLKDASVGDSITMPDGRTTGVVLAVVEPIEYVNDYGMPTSRSALALDHWTNVMTPEARKSLLATLPAEYRTMKIVTQHVARDLLDFTVTDGNLLSATACAISPTAKPDSPAHPPEKRIYQWNTFEALEQVNAALPDPGFASDYGLRYEDLKLVTDTVKQGETGAVDEMELLRVLRQGMSMLPKAWEKLDGPSDELIDSLHASESGAIARGNEAQLAGFPEHIADLLYVQSHNQPRPGRPQSTEEYYLDSRKGWNYPTTHGYTLLIEYIAKHTEAVRDFFKAQADLYDRHETMVGPLNTWKFLAQDAGVPADAPVAAEAVEDTAARPTPARMKF